MFQFVPSNNISINYLLQKDPFGEHLITINAYNLNQTQLNLFQKRMEELQRINEGYSKYQQQILTPKIKLNRKIVEEINGLINGTRNNFKNKKIIVERKIKEKIKRERRKVEKKVNDENDEEEEDVAAYNVWKFL